MRSEEHTSELQSHGTISYAVFCLKKKKKKKKKKTKKKNKRKNKSKYIYKLSLTTFSTYSLLHILYFIFFFFFFFFNDTATTEIYTVPYTLSLHDALPIFGADLKADDAVGFRCP